MRRDRPQNRRSYRRPLGVGARKANLLRCFRGGRPCVPSPLHCSGNAVNVFRAGDTELAFLTNEYSHSGRVTSPREKGQNRRSYMSVNQRSRKAKTTFETRRTTSNVVFLMSYVSIRTCGRVLRVCGNRGSRDAEYLSLMHLRARTAAGHFPRTQDTDAGTHSSAYHSL